jgi:hypothetical protein
MLECHTLVLTPRRRRLLLGRACHEEWCGPRRLLALCGPVCGFLLARLGSWSVLWSEAVHSSSRQIGLPSGSPVALFCTPGDKVAIFDRDALWRNVGCPVVTATHRYICAYIYVSVYVAMPA